MPNQIVQCPQLLCLAFTRRSLIPLVNINPLLEGVCPGAPPSQEGCQSDGLEGLGNDGDTDGLKGALLLEHLGNELRLITC